MRKITALFFTVCLAFISVADAQKRSAAKPFTTSGFYNGISIGVESGDPGGMSVFLTESDGQLFALVMTAAGDFFEPVLVEAKQSGKDMRTVEFTLSEPSKYDSRSNFKGIVSAKALTMDFENKEKMTLKRGCGSLYSNIAMGSGGDYGGMEVFLADAGGTWYALVTIAEGVLLRPILVKADMKLKNFAADTFEFTLPNENGNRKFTGKMTKTGMTLKESGTPMVLKNKCYQ